MLDQEIEQKADEIIKAAKELHFENVRSLRDAVKLVPQIVKAVEAACWAASGTDKKALAVAITNKLIDIPYVPEPAEAVIYGAAIDVCVNTLNQLIGQNWLERINR